MQRVQLYNLHKATCFIVACFAFKMDKLLSDQISTLRRNNTNEEFLFSCFTFLSPVQIVALFTLHLSPYFVFIYGNILGGKKDKIRKKRIHLVQKKNRCCTAKVFLKAECPTIKKAVLCKL